VLPRRNAFRTVSHDRVVSGIYLFGGYAKNPYLWDVPTPLDDPIRQVERSIQISTGMVLLDDGSLHILDSSSWNEHRARTD
jgi:hypothetical protein